MSNKENSCQYCGKCKWHDELIQLEPQELKKRSQAIWAAGDSMIIHRRCDYCGKPFSYGRQWQLIT